MTSSSLSLLLSSSSFSLLFDLFFFSQVVIDDETRTARVRDRQVWNQRTWAGWSPFRRLSLGSHNTTSRVDEVHTTRLSSRDVWRRECWGITLHDPSETSFTFTMLLTQSPSDSPRFRWGWVVASATKNRVVQSRLQFLGSNLTGVFTVESANLNRDI